MKDARFLSALERWFRVFGYFFIIGEAVLAIVIYTTSTGGLNGLVFLGLPMWFLIGGAYLLLASGVRKRAPIARTASAVLLPLSAYLSLALILRLLLELGALSQGSRYELLGLLAGGLALLLLPVSVFLFLFDKDIKALFRNADAPAVPEVPK